MIGTSARSRVETARFRAEVSIMTTRGPAQRHDPFPPTTDQDGLGQG